MAGIFRQAAAVATDTSGQYWRGENFNDLAEYVQEYRAGGYPVARVGELACANVEARPSASTLTMARAVPAPDA